MLNLPLRFPTPPSIDHRASPPSTISAASTTPSSKTPALHRAAETPHSISYADNSVGGTAPLLINLLTFGGANELCSCLGRPPAEWSPDSSPIKPEPRVPSTFPLSGEALLFLPEEEVAKLVLDMTGALVRAPLTGTPHRKKLFGTPQEKAARRKAHRQAHLSEFLRTTLQVDAENCGPNREHHHQQQQPSAKQHSMDWLAKAEERSAAADGGEDVAFDISVGPPSPAVDVPTDEEGDVMTRSAGEELRKRSAVLVRV